MGFYSSTLIEDRGVVFKKRAVRFFRGVHSRNASPRQTNSPASKAFRAGVLRTTAPGVPLYGYRHLSTELGRWVNRDPLGERGGLNVYGFARNNSVYLLDPLGEYSIALPGFGAGFGAICGYVTLSVTIPAWAPWVAAGTVVVGGVTWLLYERTGTYTETTQVYREGDCGCYNAEVNTVHHAVSATYTSRTPATGNPGSRESFPDGTEREYGPDGKAKRDIDHGHDHGHGDPHVHDWDWGKTPPRQPGRAPHPGEVL